MLVSVQVHDIKHWSCFVDWPYTLQVTYLVALLCNEAACLPFNLLNTT